MTNEEAKSMLASCGILADQVGVTDTDVVAVIGINHQFTLSNLLALALKCGSEDISLTYYSYRKENQDTDTVELVLIFPLQRSAT